MINHFGLDIGTETIKIIQVFQSDQGKLRLLSAGLAKNPLLGFFSEDEKDLIPLVDTIKKLKEETKIQSPFVVASLPDRTSYTQIFEMPKMSENELKKAIPWEAESLIPRPLSEVVLDWQILEDEKSDKAGKVKILLVAAPKSLIDNYMKVLKMAGLQVLALETELLADFRALAPIIDKRSLVVFNFGIKSSDISVIKKGNLFMTRSLSSSGESLTRAVSVGLNLDAAVAEEYKKTYGLKDSLEGKISSTLEPILGILSNEINKAIHFYEEKEGEQLGLIVLTGGSSLLPGLAEFLTKALGIEVQIANPFSYLEVDPSSLAVLMKNGSLYTVSLGLAMRNF